MTHPSIERLVAMADGRVHDFRVLVHVDRCVACRRELAALGKSLPEIARLKSRVRFVALGAVATLAFALLATGRSLSFGFLEIFEPRTIAVVPMTVADYREFGQTADFAAFGSGRELLASHNFERTDVAGAQALAGYRLRLPSAAAGLEAVHFSIATPFLESFTFDESKARQSAVSHRIAFAPMPPGMSGSEVRIATGTSVLTAFDATTVTRTAHAYTFTTQGGTDARHPDMHARMRSLDNVFVAQMPTPKIGSTGVPMATMERYLLAQPGVPRRLAAAFAALRDPSTTLPIPLPADKAYAEPTRVDGVVGTCIGDDTGLGAVCVWTRAGMFYAVGGTRRMSEIVAIADSLT